MNGVSRISVTEDVALITLRHETSESQLIGKIFSEFLRFHSLFKFNPKRTFVSSLGIEKFLFSWR